MSSTVPSSVTLVKEWSSGPRQTVSGSPPGPNVRYPDQATSEHRAHEHRFITPMYKTGDGTIPNGNLSSGSFRWKTESKVETRPIGAPDYRVETEMDKYRLKIIDPRVESHHTPHKPSTLPSDFRRHYKSLDFPSIHSKRSFTKLNPLSPLQVNRVRSSDIKHVDADYLNKSLDRHRKAEVSPIKEYLKVKERDVNQPWDKPDRPGPKLPPTTSTPYKTAELEPDTPSAQKLRELREQFERTMADRDRQFDESTLERNRRLDLEKMLTPAKDIRARSQSPQPIEETWEMVSEENYRKSRSYSNLNQPPSWQFSSSFSPRSVISVGDYPDRNGAPYHSQTIRRSNQAQTQTGPPSSVYTETRTTDYSSQPPWAQWGTLPAVLVPINAAQLTDTIRKTERYSSLPDLHDDDDSGRGTLIKIKDERARKPKSIMKSKTRERESHTKEIQRYEAPQPVAHVYRTDAVMKVPAEQKKDVHITQTVNTTEENKQTEEVERRVIENRKEKKKRRREGGSSHHRGRSEERYISGGGSGTRPALYYESQTWDRRPGDQDNPPWTVPFGQSENSAWRQPAITQGYSERREQMPPSNESYMKQTTTKRYTESEREGSRAGAGHGGGGGGGYGASHGASHGGGHRMHKSQSQQVYTNGGIPPADYDYSPQPIVEFPPTLTRDGSSYQSSSLHKARSFGDWEDWRYRDNQLARRSSLERDFQNSLLMPMPPAGHNINEREYREQPIHGGKESFEKQIRADAGGYRNPDGGFTHMNQAKQEYNYKRETVGDKLR